jgi:hypothetical protein
LVVEDVRSAARSFAGITFSEGGSKVAVASAQDVWSSRMKIDQRPKRTKDLAVVIERT